MLLKRSQGKSALGQLMPNWQSRLFVLTEGIYIYIYIYMYIYILSRLGEMLELKISEEQRKFAKEK